MNILAMVVLALSGVFDFLDTLHLTELALVCVALAIGVYYITHKKRN